MVLNIVFFLINILILAVIYLVLRRRIDKLTDPDRITSALAGDLDIILSEINQATDRNILIIEDKVGELETIIETAEKRIRLLKQSVPENQNQYQAARKAPETAPKPATKPATKPAPKSNDGQMEFEKGELTYSHLNKLNIMSEMVTPLTVNEKKAEESADIKSRVLELYKNGLDSSIIASNVGINRGEVELIISLYKQINRQE